MQITEQSFVSKSLHAHLFLKKNCRKLSKGIKFRTTLARKRDLSENSRAKQGPIFPLKVSNTILARAMVAVFGLGFIDAGYSGDWSRIGVISKGSEDLLKAAAFVVVPLCLFLILSLSREPNS
ncbi:uncharacterized protein LOC131157851 [Malania oleifera]|uniref:uncharacterized protein LOC131157851 n=1 Tax=Malania oleifera TaxID=397392 RepID=UPI0025ADAE17|nr:uncharacterized protein LOC131157851 [Malania oleifera]